MRNTIVSVLALSLSSLATACVDVEDAELGEDMQEICYDCEYESPPPQPQDPPIPPQPTVPYDYTYDVNVPRFILSQVGDDMVRDVNADPEIDGSMSWRGDRPDRCGYNCNTSAWLPYPGIDYVKSTTTLKFRYSEWWSYRDISIPVQIRGWCSRWSTGAGQRVVQFKVMDAVVSGGSWFESIVNFFSNGHLSAYVSQKVAQAIPGATASTFVLPGTCDSLGIRSGYPSYPLLDAFTWDM